jgi:predicted nucleic acid-binding protein
LRYYLDTSALVKLLIDEDASDIADDLFDATGDLHTCRIAYPETRAAIAAASRAGRLDDAERDRARDALDTLVWPDLVVIEVTSELATAAGDLAEAWSLRGFHAVHLAAALEVASDDLIVATWDARLWHAARAEGLRVTPADLPGA